MKTIRGWKVIRHMSRRSARNINFTVWYEPNVLTVPKLEVSCLMFFKSREQAIKFASYGELVVPCIAYDVSKPKYVCSLTYDIEKFWKLRNAKKSVKSISAIAPKGTYFAKAIKCLK